MNLRDAQLSLANRRWVRPGIYGMALDSATGAELDRQGAIHGCAREPARLFGWQLPWGQTDEAYRKRIFLHYQEQWQQ